MTDTTTLSGRGLLELRAEIEEFFYLEADLLDEYRFEEWLELFSDEVRYWMPISRDVRTGGSVPRYGEEALEVAWIDEGKETLSQRVAQLGTGVHWAEEPLSRTSHLVTNVRIRERAITEDGADQLSTSCRFLIYRNRLQDEQDILVGKRRDTLRREHDQWRITARTILLDQNVLLAKNLSFLL